MAQVVKETPTSSQIPQFVPFGELYYAQDTGDLWVGTGFSAGSDFTPGNPGPNVNIELVSSPGGSPGGFSGDIQYNNNGALGGSAASITAAGTINIPTGQNYEINGVPIGGGSSAWAALTGDLTSTQVIPFDGSVVGTPDTGISRLSPGVVGIGTGSSTSTAGGLIVTTATISAITGSLAGLQLATPSAPTITPNTSGGGTSYSYKIVAKDQNGTTLAGILSTCGSIASTAGSTSTGQSVLSGSVYNTLAWAAVTGAVSYDVYRTVGGATQGYIGNTSLLTFNDTGLTGNGWTAPAYNTSGSVVDAFDSQAGNGNFFTSIGEVWKAGAPSGYGGIGATNRVDMALRYVSETMVVNKITVLNDASANASETAGFGMYDQNLNLVAHTTFAHTVLVAGGTPTAYSSAVLEATPPTIVPGWYWFAFTSSGTTIAATFGYYGSSATVGQYLSILKNVTRITRGGNAASAGVLPATQTLQGTNDGYSGMFVVYET